MRQLHSAVFDPDDFNLMDWMRESVRLRRPYWERRWTTHWLRGVLFWPMGQSVASPALVVIVALLILTALGQRARSIFVENNPARMERTTDSRR